MPARSQCSCYASTPCHSHTPPTTRTTSYLPLYYPNKVNIKLPSHPPPIPRLHPYPHPHPHNRCDTAVPGLLLPSLSLNSPLDPGRPRIIAVLKLSDPNICSWNPRTPALPNELRCVSGRLGGEGSASESMSASEGSGLMSMCRRGGSRGGREVGSELELELGAESR